MLSKTGIYAAYLRKSRADAELEAKGQFETLAHHTQILKALAEREGIHIATWYREIVSGDTIQDRPQMQALLRDVRAGLYDGVLVTEVSRLARGRTADQATVSDAFQMHGTLIITPAKIYNPADDADETFIDFELFMARQEFKYIKKRLKAGKRQALLDGCFIGSRPPFGYDHDAKNKTLVPNADAPFVTKLLHDFADGNVTVAAAVRLMWAYTGQKTWSYTSLRYLLTNPCYIGMSQIDLAPKVKTTDEHGQVIAKRIENKKPTVVKAKWDGLIDAETHAKILARFGDSPRVKDGKPLVNPFAGLLRCGKCGRIMKINRTNSEIGRVSHLFGNASGGCHCASAPVVVLLAELANHFEDELPKIRETLEAESKEIDTAPLVKKLADAKRKQDRLYDLFEDGTYSAEEFKARRQVNQDLIATLEEQIRSAKEQPHRPSITISTDDAIRLLRDPHPNAKAINDFLKAFIDHIDYFRETPQDEPEIFIYPKM